MTYMLDLPEKKASPRAPATISLPAIRYVLFDEEVVMLAVVPRYAELVGASSLKTMVELEAVKRKDAFWALIATPFDAPRPMSFVVFKLAELTDESRRKIMFDA